MSDNTNSISASTSVAGCVDGVNLAKGSDAGCDDKNGMPLSMYIVYIRILTSTVLYGNSTSYKFPKNCLK